MSSKVYLVPSDGRKSFYNKCYVEDMGDTLVLVSYTTKVAVYTKATNKLVVHDTYSATTTRHIKSFIDYLGLPNGNTHFILKTYSEVD